VTCVIAPSAPCSLAKPLGCCPITNPPPNLPCGNVSQPPGLLSVSMGTTGCSFTGANLFSPSLARGQDQKQSPFCCIPARIVTKYSVTGTFTLDTLVDVSTGFELMKDADAIDDQGACHGYSTGWGISYGCGGARAMSGVSVRTTARGCFADQPYISCSAFPAGFVSTSGTTSQDLDVLLQWVADPSYGFRMVASVNVAYADAGSITISTQHSLEFTGPAHT